MPKEKVLYVCDGNHNEQDVPLELKETVPYPENMHYGIKDSIHYYYICPSCSKTYLAYQKIDEPIEWSSLEQEVWDKRIANVREARVSILKKGLDEQKTAIERVHSETERSLKETIMKKEGCLKDNPLSMCARYFYCDGLSVEKFSPIRGFIVPTVSSRQGCPS